MKKWIWVLLFSFFLTFPLEAKLSDQELAVILKKYQEAVQVGDGYLIGKYLKELARDDSTRVVKVLIKASFQFEDKKVHDACGEALRSLKSPEAVDYLMKNMDSSDPRVQILLVEALQDKGGAKVTKAIAKLLKSSYSPVVLTSLRALSMRQDRISVPFIIELLKKQDKNKSQGLISFEARTALNKITGQDYLTGEEWEKYWLVGGNSSSGNSSGRTVVREIKRTGSKFFTETVVSERVLFIIDVSASMEEKDPFPPEGRGTTAKQPDIPPAQLPDSRMRIERVKVELARVIQGLSEKAYFNVIAFESKIYPWDSQMRQATPSNKASAIQFAQQFKARGKTGTHAALKEAFNNKQADTFYLLSDGEPTIGPSTATILEFVYQTNRFRKVTLHTMGFPGVNRDFMMRLSQDNFGRYSDIR